MAKKKITKAHSLVCFEVPHAVLITVLRQGEIYPSQLRKIISKETGLSIVSSNLSRVVCKLAESKLLLVKKKGRVKYIRLSAKGKRVAFNLEQIRLKMCNF